MKVKKVRLLTENNDKYGHQWIDRGHCVCPHICKRCKALSGTDKAFEPCLAAGRAMIEIKADRFPIHRCIYCKGKGEENIFVLSDRWDNNPELDPENINGTTVTMNGDMFEILYDDSSRGLGAPICFQLVAKRLSKIEKIKRLRAETGAPLMPTKILLDSHSYDDAKQIIMNVQKEIEDREGASASIEDWMRGELGSMPFWKRQIVTAGRPRLAAGESDD